jgi:formylmethanofuran dehydrogenase subunit E
MTNQNQREKINSLIEKAAEFHGHLGPFLVLGLRMGLLGLKELGTRPGDTRLHATVTLQDKVPFSCMLDGVQMSTKCTIGNKRLSWKESRKFGAEFSFNGQPRVRVELDSAIVDDLKHRLGKRLSNEEVQQLARDIAFRPESELFSVRRK